MVGGRVTEAEISIIVLQVASEQGNRIATYDLLREEIPKRLTLSEYDLRPSPTRNGEAVWEQQMRNIQSHHSAEGNIISDGYAEHVKGRGYRITELGLKLVNG